MKRSLTWAILLLASVTTGAVLAQTPADKPSLSTGPLKDTVPTIQEVIAELREIKALLTQQDKRLDAIQGDVNPGFVKIVAQDLAVDFVKDLLQPGSVTHTAGLLASGLSILIGFMKLGYWIWKWRKLTGTWNKVSKAAMALWLIVIGGLLLVTQSQAQIGTYNSAPTEKLEKLSQGIEQLSQNLKSAGKIPIPAESVSEQIAMLRTDISKMDMKVSQSAVQAEAWSQRIYGKFSGGFQTLLVLITMILAGYCALRLWLNSQES
jgi:hypothetical protein